MNTLFIMPANMSGQAGASTHVRELISNISRYMDNLTVLSPTNRKDNLNIDNVKFKHIRLIKAPFLIAFSFSVFAFISGFHALLTSKYHLIYHRDSIFPTGGILSKIFKIPCVLEVNGLPTDEQKIQGVLARIIRKTESINFSLVSRIVVVAPGLKQALQSEYGVPEEKIIVIPNGANTNLFKPLEISKARKQLNLNQKPNYICFCGHLVWWQGVEYLIKAAPLILEKHPNTRFLIVGDGPMEAELVKLTEETRVSDKVVFTGAVPYEKVPLYINASDICVAPFIQFINKKGGTCSLKMPEYLACGKPLVISKLSGLDIVEHSNMGILVEPENPEALANATIKLFQNPELRKEMGGNGRKYVVDNRSWESVARRVAEVCEKAVEEHKAKSQGERERKP